jgi:hypothetical protein
MISGVVAAMIPKHNICKEMFVLVSLNVWRDTISAGDRVPQYVAWRRKRDNKARSFFLECGLFDPTLMKRKRFKRFDWNILFLL